MYSVLLNPISRSYVLPLAYLSAGDMITQHNHQVFVRWGFLTKLGENSRVASNRPYICPRKRFRKCASRLMFRRYDFTQTVALAFTYKFYLFLRANNDIVHPLMPYLSASYCRERAFHVGHCGTRGHEWLRAIVRQVLFFHEIQNAKMWPH